MIIYSGKIKWLNLVDNGELNGAGEKQACINKLDIYMLPGLDGHF